MRPTTIKLNIFFTIILFLQFASFTSRANENIDCDDKGLCIEKICSDGKCRSIYFLSQDAKENIETEMIQKFKDKTKVDKTIQRNPFENDPLFNQEPTSLNNNDTQILAGKVIRIDTRNLKRCLKIQKELLEKRKEGFRTGSKIYKLCTIANDRDVKIKMPLIYNKKPANRPTVSLYVAKFGIIPSEIDEIKKQSIYDKAKVELNEMDRIYSSPSLDTLPLMIRSLFKDYINNLPKRYKKLLTETKDLSKVSLGLLSVMYLLPGDVTNWTKNGLDPNTLWKQYRDHVTNPPVWDKDAWAVNYIGHAWSGAIFFRLGRECGLSNWEAAGFSLAMSTLFWEYGIEGFHEEPSIQDLIYTPIGGTLLGIAAESLEEKIDKNGGKLFGLRWAGKGTKTIIDYTLNPTEHIIRGVNFALGKVGIKKLSKHVKISITSSRSFKSNIEIASDFERDEPDVFQQYPNDGMSIYFYMPLK